MLKVVFHIDEMQVWPRLMSNLDNFLEQKPDSDLKVVVNGDAVTKVLDSVIQTFIENHSTIDFLICHNALHSHQMTDSQISKPAKVVLAGVVAIAELEANGYSYIKP